MMSFRKWAWMVVVVAAMNGFPLACGQALPNGRDFPQIKSLTLTGSVFAPSGAPANGVGVIVPANIHPQTPSDNIWEPRSFTDENGGYSLTWWQRSPSVPTVLLARDVQHNLVATANIDQKSSNVDLRLQPGLTISFKVEDPVGNPITNAEAQLNMLFGKCGVPLTRQHSGSGAAERDRIEFAALPAGYRVWGWVRAPGHSLVYLPLATNGSKLTNSLDLGVVVLKVPPTKPFEQ